VVNARPRRFTPRYAMYRRLGGSQGRYGQAWKISPTPGFDPRTVETAVSWTISLSGTSLKTSGESVYRRWKCYLVQTLQMKCPNFLCQLTPSVSNSVTHLTISNSARVEGIITNNNFSLQTDKSADNRGDVKSSSIVIPPPLISLSAMKGRVADEYVAYNARQGMFLYL